MIDGWREGIRIASDYEKGKARDVTVQTALASQIAQAIKDAVKDERRLARRWRKLK